MALDMLEYKRSSSEIYRGSGEVTRIRSARRLRGNLRAYAELARPANVTTAAADVLAGYAVAGLGNPAALPWLLFASMSLYAGGVVCNDFFDRHLDAVERPERPIPSGRVHASAAAVLGFALLCAGIIAAAQATSAATAIACSIVFFVLLYDVWSKHHRAIAPLNMGLCRGLNFLIGVAAVPAALGEYWFLSLLSFTYISAVTLISAGEVYGGTRRVAIFSLSLIVAVVLALAVLAQTTGNSIWAGWAITCFLAWRVIPPFWRACNDSQPALIRNAVKTGVLSLVLLDAAIGAIFAGPLYSLIILATAVLAMSLAKLFAVT